MGQIQACHLQTTTDVTDSDQFPSPVQIYTKDKKAVRIVELCYAASNGDLDVVKKLLEKGVEVNSRDYDQRSALHLASCNGHLEVVQHLISARADVQALDRWGHTVLDDAVTNGYEDVQAALRSFGAELGETPRAMKSFADGLKLCSAAALGDVTTMMRLESEGTDLNAVDYDGRSALHVASANGQLELVEWLLSSKANANARDKFGLTCLAEAVRNGHENVAKVLRDKGAKPADLESLRLSSNFEHWAIPSKEVELGKILSKTLKSCIYIATWRGTRVVAKTSGPLTRSTSGASIVDLASQDDSEESTHAIAAKEVLHEIQLLSTMRHPDLVMFLGACLDSSPPFFITEYMEGGDLERYYMSRSKQGNHSFRPSWDLFLKWASAVARALCFLHSRPIIHRDLKPLNLLLNRTLDLKVTDFGISKLVRPEALGGSSLKGDGRMSGGVGTWRYMAPEVVRYEQYTDRVDIYSFALILWFMYTGLQPFVAQFGNDAEVVLKEYLQGKEPRPDVTYTGSRCGPTIPRALHEFLQDCWHETTAFRPSAHDCTKRLETMSLPGGHSNSGVFSRMFT
mmetsp:Transcript_94675/g.276847  ORF Transcript_94675/g.276847 Transcript_94675/m.276847 type:complete len:571 (+) Transcript_94675:59-1771(+)